MSEKHKETLSALMDGECSEFEMQQVVKTMTADGETRDTWYRYHYASAVIKGEPVADNSLADKVRLALAADDGHSQKTWRREFAKVAVAASVALGIVTSVQFLQMAGNETASTTVVTRKAGSTAVTLASYPVSPSHLLQPITLQPMPLQSVSLQSPARHANDKSSLLLLQNTGLQNTDKTTR